MVTQIQLANATVISKIVKLFAVSLDRLSRLFGGLYTVWKTHIMQYKLECFLDTYRLMMTLPSLTPA